MRPSWVEVDLAAVRHNVAVIAAEVEPSRMCVVVKADGYGHGDVPVAEAAVEAGATWLAVAFVSEGIGLRESGLDVPILVLSEPDPGDAGEVVRWALTPTVYGEAFITALGMLAPAGFPVHLKVDTGMHRVGVAPERARQIAALVDAGPLRLQGVWTHFPVAEHDHAYTSGQVATLTDVVAGLATEGIVPEMVHAANTAGALADIGARLDMVRIGLGTYGLRPLPGYAPQLELRPAMRVVSRVTHVARHPAGARPSYGRRRPLGRESTVVTVPVGYADGLTRRLSETGGGALIGGERHPFAGTVTMDQVLIDVGDAEVSVGDEVVLLGRQGDAEITADEWAQRLETISWEVVCGFGPRLPRRYVG
jgi:alanine racemase